ncbi:MAG TPA: type II secretion system F family protein [Abditibacteriaceae bacterium]|jgi:hypothetical protein
MVERREIITICRHIGNMMEAGVDILRITQVLRAQTENERLLQIYHQFDRDLKMGASIAEAMARASDVFSPFMVSLVRQAEQRSDLESVSSYVAAAFLKIADFVQQDEEEAREEAREAAGTTPVVEAVISTPLDISAVADSANTWPLTLRAIENFTDRLQLIALRGLTLLAGLLLSLAAVWYSVEMQWIERQWQNVVLCSVAALFIACAGVWVRRQIENEKRRASQCSFCHQADSADSPLRPIPGFPGAAICARCVGAMGQAQSQPQGQSQNTTVSNGVDVATNSIASTPTSKAHKPASSPIALRENAEKNESSRGAGDQGFANGAPKTAAVSNNAAHSLSLNAPRPEKQNNDRSKRSSEHKAPQAGKQFEPLEEADYE